MTVSQTLVTELCNEDAMCFLVVTAEQVAVKMMMYSECSWLQSRTDYRIFSPRVLYGFLQFLQANVGILTTEAGHDNHLPNNFTFIIYELLP